MRRPGVEAGEVDPAHQDKSQGDSVEEYGSGAGIYPGRARTVLGKGG